jgi:hypothetical protein
VEKMEELVLILTSPALSLCMAQVVQVATITVLELQATVDRMAALLQQQTVVAVALTLVVVGTRVQMALSLFVISACLQSHLIQMGRALVRRV